MPRGGRAPAPAPTARGNRKNSSAFVRDPERSADGAGGVMTGTFKTREHRARELLNLITLATRCANLADQDEAERRRWREEARQALEELHHVWPHASPWADELPNGLP